MYCMYKKGARTLQVGVEPNLLSRSAAWELSPDPDTTVKQVACTRNLTRISCDGLMAEPSGAERYLSAASSHTTQFARAVCVPPFRGGKTKFFKSQTQKCPMPKNRDMHDNM